ncbi:MAG: hypothetical protein OEU92_17830 [Alphaproteobacteria bacterium]|nr:hypothetical protein [Alphaproteobacteria bacterium]
MTAGKDQLQGISVIEHMAEAHYVASYRGAPPIVSWLQLEEPDRQRRIDAMEATWRALPDELVLKHGVGTAIAKVGEVRDAIISDHEQAKRSVLYGR